MKMTFGPDDDAAFEATCEELVRRFTAFLEPLKLDADPYDLDLLLTWKRNYGDGRLGHWTRNELTEFLLGWCPRKLSATAAEVHGLPATVGLAMSFLAQENLHSGEPIAILLNHAIAQQDEFMQQMDNAENFGMAKSVFGQLDLDPESAGPADFQRAIDEFNARPQAERQRITDPALASTHPLGETFGMDPSQFREDLGDPESLGPVMMPSEEAVTSSAAASPLLAGFVALADYIGPDGKPLTDNGNLKIADAAALAEVLGTGEEVDQQIGQKSFERTSSLDFPKVDHWQWWAWEAGAIRKKGDRIVANRSWLRRCKADPVGALLKAFFVMHEKYGLLGGLGSGRSTPIAEALDELVDAMLGRMLQEERTGFDEVVAVTEPLVDELGIKLLPGQFASTWDRMITLLERIGILTQQGAIPANPRDYKDARSGGTLQLTPIGIVIAVDLAQRAGIEVEEIPPPEELHPADLVSLAETQTLSPEDWWAVVDGWFEACDDKAKLEDLITLLGITNLSGLVVVLEKAPPIWRDRLVPLLRARLEATDRDTAGIRAVAINWLVGLDALHIDDGDQEKVQESLLVNFALMAEQDPLSVITALSADSSREDVLTIIAEAGRRLIPGIVPLLEVIGAEFPDKVVAKAARKELFRVRSKLVAEGR